MEQQPDSPGPLADAKSVLVTVKSADQSTPSSPPGHLAQLDTAGNAPQQPQQSGDKESQTLSEKPESLVTSPLSHPNGMAMFPTLSTSEQQYLSLEALTQAEETIVADVEQSQPEDDNEGTTDRDSATDGGYESDAVSTASTSAESSIRDYMYENGRRYHRFREGMYNFPNDDVEQEREDMKHAMMKLLCSQKLHFAPINNNPQEMMDVGTGTGIWAIESEQHV